MASLARIGVTSTLTFALLCVVQSTHWMLVKDRSTWRYWDDGPVAEPDAAGRTWTQPDFHDAAWRTGSGLFGYSDDDSEFDTVLAHRSSAGEPEATVYFRRAFGVSASQLAAWGVMADARTGTAAPTSMTIRWRTSVLSRTALRYAVAPSSYVPGVGVGVDAVPEVNWTVVNTDRCASIDQRVTLNQLRPHTRYLYQILPELPLSSSSRVPSRLLTAGDDSVTAVHSFITSPAVSDTRTALRAWFIGDSGTGTVRQTRVRDAYLAIRTRERRRDSFLFALGDNAYEWGTEHEVQAHFFDVYGRLLYDTPLWSAFGNHDFYGAKSPKRDGAYFIAFPMPGDGRAGGAPSNTSAFYRFEQAT